MTAASLSAVADSVLRPVRNGTRVAPASRLLLCVLVYAGLYGATMGLYRMTAGQPQWQRQAIYSAAKAPLLIVGSLAVSLPTFFVLGTLLGMRRDFAPAVRSILAGQAAMAVTLAALAPVTLLQYASGASYQQALALNGVVFAAASLAGQTVVRRRFRTLQAKPSTRRRLLLGWGVAYVLVAIQLAWLLRPFIGSAGKEVTFLRQGAWDNAYVVVVRLVWRTLFGG